MTPDETARRNGWTPEKLAAYQAERDAALEMQLELRANPGAIRSVRASMAGTFPRLRFTSSAPPVDDAYDYQRGRR